MIKSDEGYRHGAKLEQTGSVHELGLRRRNISERHRYGWPASLDSYEMIGCCHNDQGAMRR